jgi:hypothetical protein
MKEQVISFKVNEELYNELNKIPNKSEFIRNSILKAMDNLCPLCHGTGFLSKCQKEHWEEFSKDHTLQHCHVCSEPFIVCNTGE